MKFFELSLRMYDRGTGGGGNRYRLLVFDGSSESARFEAQGESIAATIFHAGFELVRVFAIGLTK